MKATALLLVWALAVAGVDAAVIVRGDADPKPATRSAPSSTTTASATTVTARATTTSFVSELTTTTASGPRPESTTRPSSGEVVVAQVSGDGETPATVSFHANGRWQLRWRVDAAGPGAAITVDDDDRGSQRYFTGLIPGQGSIDFDEGCNCTLHVTPDGSGYDLMVVDVEG